MADLVKRIVVPEEPVYPGWLWQPKDEFETINELELPEKTYLCFGVFWLDIYLNEKDTEQELEKVLEQLRQRFHQWNERYPWSEYNGVTLRLERLVEADKRPYIFGYHCVEDNIEDEEGIIFNILHDFSRSTSQQVFIKVCDTDGDFILNHCNSVIPSEFEYPVANNRLWMHEAKMKMIPVSYYPDRGLKAEECIEFLMKGVYKCTSITEIEEQIQKDFLQDFPTTYLGNLRNVPLEIPDNQIFGLIKENPGIVSLLIKRLLIPGTGDNHIKQKPGQDGRKVPSVDVKIPKNILSILMMYIRQFCTESDLETWPKYCGIVLSSLLQTSLENNDIQIIETTKSLPVGDLFSDIKVQSLDPQEKLEMDQSKVPDTFETMINLLKEENDGSADDGIGERESTDGDETVRQYFKEENVDIDEDDFFEYFLTEALGVKGDELSGFLSADKESTTTDDIKTMFNSLNIGTSNK